MTEPDEFSTNRAEGYSVDALKKYIGISKPQYEYRRNAIDSDRVPNTRFSDGDLITYRIVSRLVDRCRIPLAWLAKHD